MHKLLALVRVPLTPGRPAGEPDKKHDVLASN